MGDGQGAGKRLGHVARAAPARHDDGIGLLEQLQAADTAASTDGPAFVRSRPASAAAVRKVYGAPLILLWGPRMSQAMPNSNVQRPS